METKKQYILLRYRFEIEPKKYEYFFTIEKESKKVQEVLKVYPKYTIRKLMIATTKEAVILEKKKQETKYKKKLIGTNIKKLLKKYNQKPKPLFTKKKVVKEKVEVKHSDKWDLLKVVLPGLTGIFIFIAIVCLVAFL